MGYQPDWVIHYVSEKEPCEIYGHVHENKDGIHYNGFDCFVNIHTHGLGSHGHRELCIPFELEPNVAMGVLNNCGYRIDKLGMIFKEGIDDTVLDGYSVKFISFNNDPTLYMLMPDENNHFPGDEQCSSPYCNQEIYAKIISEGKDYV